MAPFYGITRIKLAIHYVLYVVGLTWFDDAYHLMESRTGYMTFTHTSRYHQTVVRICNETKIECMSGCSILGNSNSYDPNTILVYTDQSVKYIMTVNQGFVRFTIPNIPV